MLKLLLTPERQNAIYKWLRIKSPFDPIGFDNVHSKHKQVSIVKFAILVAWPFTQLAKNRKINKNKTKMETEMCFFKMVKNILNKCGLYVYDDSITIFIYLKYLMIIFFLFATFVTSFHYVLLNLNDIQKASTALFAANIMFIGSIYYSMMFQQKTQLRSLIGEIESIVKTRKLQQHQSKIY